MSVLPISMGGASRLRFAYKAGGGAEMHAAAVALTSAPSPAQGQIAAACLHPLLHSGLGCIPSQACSTSIPCLDN